MTDVSVPAGVKSAAQRAALHAGITRANAIAASDPPDQRIPYDQIVTHRVPSFLTNDYDPSYRAAVRTRSEHVADEEARAIGEALVANGTWKRCPECGEGIATSLRVHATCEQQRKAGAA